MVWTVDPLFLSHLNRLFAISIIYRYFYFTYITSEFLSKRLEQYFCSQQETYYKEKEIVREIMLGLAIINL